jgi:hypothetical protein
MRYLKKFNLFEGNTAPAKPTVKPGTPTKPAPNRPTPIRRERPSTDPKPKMASAEEVVKRFVSELKKLGAEEIEMPDLKKLYGEND